MWGQVRRIPASTYRGDISLEEITIVKHQGNEREIRIPLVTKSSEKIDLILEEEIRNKIADISQINIEEMIRKYNEEEAVRLMNEIIGK